MTVQFGYEPSDKSPGRFLLSERKLESVTSAAATNLQAPVTFAEELTITDWAYTISPKLNGHPLPLNQYERSSSLAISPDHQHFLLGTETRLRLFDRSGKERWRVFAPGQTSEVNISGDGRLAVAAYADGTIRWYRISDGKELLAFFSHVDRKRWVAWTPSGYYDASPGAEGLIGWHVNEGKDAAADFFPVGQFRATFYRPDVVGKVLEAGDEQTALRQANEEAGRRQQQADVSRILPPVIEIISPSDGAEISNANVKVRYKVRTPSGEPVTAIKVLVDGRPVASERGLGLQADGQEGVIRERGITLGENNSEVSVIAENKYTTSVPATVHVRVRGLSVANANEFVIKPKLYILAIGISQYANPAYKLGYPAKDAQDFADAMMKQKGVLYRDVVVKVLINSHATKDDVEDGLDWIRKETTSKDVAMVFFAGHGINDQNGVYYFLPYNTDLERLLRTGVPFTDIKNTVQSLAGKTLFFIDTCHSGNVLGTRRGILDDITGVVNELASAENGAVVFAASTGNQYSLENAAWNNGAFTKALVEGINGRADYVGKGRITINMLDLYISERVKELTKGLQTPTTAKPQTMPDFPIAVKR